MPTKPLPVSYAHRLRLFPSVWHKVGLVLLGAVALTYPLWASSRWQQIGTLALVAVVGSIALMLLTGFTGQISLGHAAFLALGAYTAGALGAHLGAPFWLVIPAAGLVAAAVGVAVGPFALRLRGLYLAIVTLGLIFVVNHVLRALPDITGGLSGLRVPMYWWFEEGGTASTFGSTVALGPLELGFGAQVFYLFLLLAAFTAWFAKNLQRSRTGRAMASVRDRDIAAAVVGVDLARIKVTAFGLSSFFAGVAGAMFAFQQRFITIDPPFNIFLSIEYIAMIIIGGIGTVLGAVLGALVFIMLGPFAEGITGRLDVLGGLTSSQQQTLLASIVVVAFMVVEPLGLYGIWLRVKRYFLAWPFRY